MRDEVGMMNMPCLMYFLRCKGTSDTNSVTS